MRFELRSDQTEVVVSTSTKDLHPTPARKTAVLRNAPDTRFVSVNVPSTATTVSWNVKPAVVELETATERTNRAVRLGYLPVRQSTSK